MKKIISNLSLQFDLNNENLEQRLLRICKCFYMKIFNVDEYIAYDKNNAKYGNVATFPQ